MNSTHANTWLTTSQVELQSLRVGATCMEIRKQYQIASTIDTLIQKLSRNETSVTYLLPMKRIIYNQTNPNGLKRFYRYFWLLVAKTIVTKMKQSHEAPVEQFSSTSDLNKKTARLTKIVETEQQTAIKQTSLMMGNLTAWIKYISSGSHDGTTDRK